jgi:hypothetical protein
MSIWCSVVLPELTNRCDLSARITATMPPALTRDSAAIAQVVWE